MVLEVINSSLSHNLPGNPHLLYSLLYQHEMFEEFRLHPAFNDIISNIEMVCVWLCDVCTLIVAICMLFGDHEDLYNLLQSPTVLWMLSLTLKVTPPPIEANFQYR